MTLSRRLAPILVCLISAGGAACGRGGFDSSARADRLGLDDAAGGDASDDGDADGDPGSDAGSSGCPACTFPDTCGGGGGAGVCGHATWFALGASSIADTGQRLEWGSMGGGGISRHDYARLFDLQADDAGTPTVMWGSTGIFVQRFTAGAWGGSQNRLADTIDSASNILDGKLFRLADGRMLAVYTLIVSPSYVLRSRIETAGVWTEFAPDIVGLSSSVGVDVARGASGEPLIAYNARVASTTTQVYVARGAIGSWSPFSAGSMSGGGVSGAGGETSLAAIATAPDGAPCVAWNSGSQYLRCWTGTAWVGLGGSDAGNGLGSATTDGYGTIGLVVPATLSPVITRITSTRDALLVARYNGGSWGDVGAGSQTVGIAEGGTSVSAARLQAGTNGAIYASFFSGSPAAAVVSRFDGNAWARLPSAGSVSTRDAFRPRLLVSSAGLVAAWEDGASGTVEVDAAQWDGTAWVATNPARQAATGGISEPGADGRSSTISIRPDGTVDVLYAYGNALAAADLRPLLRHFDTASTTWSAVAGPWIDAGPAWDIVPPHLSRTLDGRPVVFHSSISLGYTFAIGDTVAPATWTTLAAPPNARAHSIDAAGRYLTCNESSSLSVSRYDVGAWAAVGPAVSTPTSGYAANECHLARGQDQPLVMWRENRPGLGTDIYVARFDGTAWQGLASSMAPGGLTNYAFGDAGVNPRIMVSPTLGPIAVWRRSTSASVCAARFDGAAWQDLGAGSGACTGVSSAEVVALDATVDEAGFPVVVTSERTTGNSDIHVYRFGGQVWTELSDPAGGLSNSASASNEPSVDVAAGLICVTWNESDGAYTRVTARCSLE